MPDGRRVATDEDHAAAIREILAAVPPHGIWVFAYGSLIWNPEFAFDEVRGAVASGWHRAFCLGFDRWFRGSADRPGVTLALDRGGRCRGVAYRLAPSGLEEGLLGLMRREIRFIPRSYAIRWLRVTTEAGPLRALAFTMDRASPAYVGRLTPEVVADTLAGAVGPWGSMAEYLRSTVEHLEALGIHDRRLWRLQDMVADRQEAASRQPVDWCDPIDRTEHRAMGAAGMPQGDDTPACARAHAWLSY
jgi:cation transport protein ChaC